MAIFAARKFREVSPATLPCVRAAGWLSVALVVLLSPTLGQAQTGLRYSQKVPDGGLFRWEYSYVPTVALPVGGTVTVTGLFDVRTVAALTIPPGTWTAVCTSSSVTYTWQGPSVLLPSSPPALLSYTSSSDQPAAMAWADTSPETGTVTGAAPVEAHVTVYDNWLSFGAFRPTEGTSATPAPVIAKGSPASDWAPTAVIPAVGNYDVGFVQVTAPRRLNLSVRLNGHLTRCTPTGQAFAGVDTRKQTPGPYELSTQWKVAFYGRFLTQDGATTYASPTSGQPTDYNTWTGWSAGGNDPASDSGWLWPSASDAWTGQGVAGYATLEGLDLQVERGQYVGSITGGPAGICVLERVLRRGQQDVEGNYKQFISIQLTYAE